MKLLSLPTVGKVFALVAFTVPVVLLGAAAYSKIGRKPWDESLRRSYVTVTNFPDYWSEEDNQNSARLLLVLHVMGLFTFASVISVLTNDVSSAIHSVHMGKFALQESGHTLLLGYSDHTIPLLKQILAAQDPESGLGAKVLGLPVVLLTDKDKIAMDAILTQELGIHAASSLSVMSRSGSALRLTDLEQVAAGTARTVILTGPFESGVGADIGSVVVGGTPSSNGSGGAKATSDGKCSLAATLANLKALKAASGTPAQMQHIILESPIVIEDSAAEVIVRQMRASREFSFSKVQALENVGCLMAQAAVQPGLSDVLNQLATTFQGCEIYVHRHPSVAGRTFRNARHRFELATLCGLYNSRTGRHQLNPEDETVLGRDDCLLLVARNVGELQILAQPMEVPPLPEQKCNLSSADFASTFNRNILVISHTSDTAELVTGLVEFAAPGSVIKVFTERPVTDQVECADPLSSSGSGARGVTVTYATGDVSSTRALAQAGVGKADSVVLLLGNEREDVVSDARAVASVYQIQGALSLPPYSERTDPLGVVCCISEPDTARILQEAASSSQAVGAGRALKLDIFERRQLFAGILTLLAAEPRLQPVFAELFEGDRVWFDARADGSDGYASRVSSRTAGSGGKVKVNLHGPELYSITAEPEVEYQWGQLQDLIKANGGLLLGQSRSGESTLAVPRSAAVSFQPGDALVVLK